MDTSAVAAVVTEMQGRIRDLRPLYPTVPNERIDNVLNDDRFLRRCLYARHLDALEAAKKVLITLEWRQRRNVNSILELGYLEQFHPDFPMHFGNVDNANRPVIYIPVNHWQLDKLAQIKSADFKCYVISFYEQIMMELNRSRAEEQKFSLIVNVDGVIVWKLVNLRVLRKVLMFPRILKSHYSGILSSCFVINCRSSWDAYILRKFVLKPNLWRKCPTPSLLHFYSYQHPNWKGVLRSIIPSEELPVEVGGWKQFPEDVVDNENSTLSK